MAIGLVLGGGAPNLPLMTGALLALDEAGVDFKVITTTGAGMVAGLLYSAPKKQDPSEKWEDARKAALRATREWGIDDMIYEMFPANYKIFQKPGKLAEAYAHTVNPFLWSIPRETRRQRLLGDTLAFWAAAMSPSDLKASSKGLCQPPPWIEMLVNFSELEENLKKGDKKFRLSAYCIEDEDEVTFDKEEITAEHFKAALAMPFIYTPYKVTGADGNTKTYLEGSAFKTLQFNPEHVMCEAKIETIIFFDLMGNRNLIDAPRGLIDAWGQSIIAPLTRLAENQHEMLAMKRERHLLRRLVKEKLGVDDLNEVDKTLARLTSETDSEADFVLTAEEHDHEHHSEKYLTETKILRMPFRDHIPEEHWPKVLDWSYSNMSKLFDIGVETAEEFVKKHSVRLGLTKKGWKKAPKRSAATSA